MQRLVVAPSYWSLQPLSKESVKLGKMGNSRLTVLTPDLEVLQLCNVPLVFPK